MQIRAYRDLDEKGWLRCRVLAFLDTSYFDDVLQERERYSRPAVCLVAEEKGEIVGLLDAELDSDALCFTGEGRGAVLWHLAVLPEYRRRGTARFLWEQAAAELRKAGVQYCEVWTQEDEPANRFYRSMGFQLIPERCWLRCRVRGAQCRKLLNLAAVGEIFGPEELILDVPLSRREEVKERCARIDEVRLYSIRL